MPQEWMQVADLVAEYAPVYPEPYTWAETQRYLNSDPAERRVLQRLHVDLRESGRFRHPITLNRQDEEDDACVLDGTHRVVVALEAGVPQILVQYSDEWGDDSPEANRILETSLLLHPVEASEGGVLDSFIAALRSFPLDGEKWITFSFSTSRSTEAGEEIIIMWDLIGGAGDSTLTCLVRERIEQQLIAADLFLLVEEHSTEWIYCDEDEEAHQHTFSKMVPENGGRRESAIARTGPR